MTPMVDFRSDTVTMPTLAMREAMARAEVGDDVSGEDPTVNRLEELAATLMGKEAGLFVASGTMSNLVGVVAHCQRGDEVILGAESHIFWYEVAGSAVVGGVQLRALPDEDGCLDPAGVAAAIRRPDLHFPRTGLICIENTHNRQGGIVTKPERIQAVASAAHREGVPVHLDGARIFNAAIALGVPARDLVAPADSVGFCLSKGLSAPVGSVLCGCRDYVSRARRLRKMLGGGMRQAGVIAAAGIIALEQMVERLAEDHRHARRLAERLARMPGLDVDLDRVQTNIVRVRVVSPRFQAHQLVEALAVEGVRCAWMGGDYLRLVTHYGIDGPDVDHALSAFHRLLES